ncbi:MAG TPA: DUF899 domain-containing protein [Actinomycetota bacterium]|jgi:predicted dithiol-disulfide oxidoreductase (DUF899 family)|nr:DUF899 domain-containing protein [Actinomycetota bacterium]
MSLPKIVSHDEWVAARKELLKEEKALTHARDKLSSKRRELPMVRIEKDYTFEGPDGTIGLRDLFEGRRQLLVQHFMFDPSWEDGCPSCSAGADEISDGFLRHLHTRDTTFAAISRAPLEKIERYKQKKGWTFPWYSSFGSDFNYDFHVTIDPSKAPVEYNFRDADELKEAGMEWMLEPGSSEQPGHSVFLRVGDDVFHTFSSYARGAEWLGGSYAALDWTALGRQEEWEEPKGRAESVRQASPDFAS